MKKKNKSVQIPITFVRCSQCHHIKSLMRSKANLIQFRFENRFSKCTHIYWFFISWASHVHTRVDTYNRIYFVINFVILNITLYLFIIVHTVHKHALPQTQMQAAEHTAHVCVSLVKHVEYLYVCVLVHTL